MSLETYVIIPLTRYNSMESKITREEGQTSSTSHETTKPPSPVLSTNVAPSPQTVDDKKESDAIVDDLSKKYHPSMETELREETKDHTRKKSLRHKQFQKFIDAIKTFTEEPLNVDNLEELIKLSLSPNSKRKVPNEELFFNWLIRHNLIYLVKNKGKSF